MLLIDGTITRQFVQIYELVQLILQQMYMILLPLLEFRNFKIIQ